MCLCETNDTLDASWNSERQAENQIQFLEKRLVTFSLTAHKTQREVLVIRSTPDRWVWESNLHCHNKESHLLFCTLSVRPHESKKERKRERRETLKTQQWHYNDSSEGFLFLSLFWLRHDGVADPFTSPPSVSPLCLPSVSPLSPPSLPLPCPPSSLSFSSPSPSLWFTSSLLLFSSSHLLCLFLSLPHPEEEEVSGWRSSWTRLLFLVSSSSPLGPTIGKILLTFELNLWNQRSL